MLPRSCLRCADSKSNSSTRLPRRTTTRVSSGWVASISILLAIGLSHEVRFDTRFAPHRRRNPVTGPIVGEWDGLEIARAAAANDPRAGKRRMSAAASARTNLDLHLEDLPLPEDLSLKDLLSGR